MSTALGMRTLEESLDAVRALAELSPEGSSEVHDRVEQVRSLMEGLTAPIACTDIRPHRRVRMRRAA
jgi:hypothetical protein